MAQQLELSYPLTSSLYCSYSAMGRSILSLHLYSRHAGAVIIMTHSRNALMGDNSMYCKIPDPFPSTVFGKVSATPDM